MVLVLDKQVLVLVFVLDKQVLNPSLLVVVRVRDTSLLFLSPQSKLIAVFHKSFPVIVKLMATNSLLLASVCLEAFTIGATLSSSFVFGNLIWCFIKRHL